jgi:ribosomal protein L24
MGDNVEILQGPHIGDSGKIHWICPETHRVWVELKLEPMKSPVDDEDYAALRPLTVAIDVDDVEISSPLTLQHSKDKGYDVTISDLVFVARGPHFGVQGLVHSIDFVNADLIIVSREDAEKVRS